MRIGLRLIGQLRQLATGLIQLPVALARRTTRARRQRGRRPDVHLGVGSFDVEIPEFDGGGWEAASGSRAATITTHP